MLKDRISDTLKFFELQKVPLTLVELHRFLVNDKEALKQALDGEWELRGAPPLPAVPVGIDQVLQCIEMECSNEVTNIKGFYCLKGSEHLVHERLANYRYGIYREKLIWKHVPFMRHLPFVRAVALAGSQALGTQKPTSDIDLLIFTDSRFLWLPRTLISLYFQVLGRRRHGRKVANRFCLNHYLSKPKEVDRERNLYKAMEYAKLRIFLGQDMVTEFQRANLPWIQFFFPNVAIPPAAKQKQSAIQRSAEKILDSGFGRWCERLLGRWQRARINTDAFTFTTEEELSFHPESKHQELLTSFFRD